MNITDSVRTSSDPGSSRDASIEYRVIYSLIFASAFVVACLCLFLPKRLNPLYDAHERRSPVAQARMAAGGVVPYVFRV